MVPFRWQDEVQTSIAASRRAKLRRQIEMISARVTIRKAFGPLIGILLRCAVHYRRLLSVVGARLLQNVSKHRTKPGGRGGRPCLELSVAKPLARDLSHAPAARGSRAQLRLHTAPADGL